MITVILSSRIKVSQRCEGGFTLHRAPPQFLINRHVDAHRVLDGEFIALAFCDERTLQLSGKVAGLQCKFPPHLSRAFHNPIV
jgi:hypothetical protein